ncbi:MAG: hypothetical protein IK026_02385 [Eubacteriaceae bacterium]|nr:hypothetical protein [Eubacteriaceae bacterium]MBR5995413.1 hypothetical protein [Eubacteriaceae bacterium]
MSSKPNRRKNDITTRICTFLMVLITAGFCFAMVNNYIEKRRLTAERDSVLRDIEEQEELMILYKEELAKVGTDEYYEYMARKYLGYIYPDEHILIYDIR